MVLLSLVSRAYFNSRNDRYACCRTQTVNRIAILYTIMVCDGNDFQARRQGPLDKFFRRPATVRGRGMNMQINLQTNHPLFLSLFGFCLPSI